MPFCDVLTSVETTTISGRTYTVKQSDQAQASEALSTKNKGKLSEINPNLGICMFYCNKVRM